MSEENIAVVTAFWEAMGRRDFDAVGAMMSERGHYVDVAVLDADEGAFGPAETTARLRLGLDPLERYVLNDGTITASGDTVITEHTEEWYWHTGEQTVLRFCSVMEVRDGKVDRWWDYYDLGAVMNAAPEWWVTHIMAGYK